MSYFFTPPIYAEDFEIMQRAIEEWCRATGCAIDSDEGKNVSAAAIALYCSGATTADRLSVALRAVIPPCFETRKHSEKIRAAYIH
jgi:hypothetical protein